MPSIGLSNARAEASRRNGAKSRGPKTCEGKARSAQNALKHGLRAQKYMVLPDEDAAEFAALEAALMEELAPAGVLQDVLARRIVAAAWRLSRAERLEVELFAENGLPGGSLGLALVRGNRAGAFDTLVRYRGGTLAEFWRALRTLKALQSEADAIVVPARAGSRPAQPNEPECRRNPGVSAGNHGAQSSAPAPAWLPPGLTPVLPAVPLPPSMVATQARLLAGTALALTRSGP